MAIREILVEGADALTKKCHPVTKFDEKLWTLLDDLKETLTEINGLGLAAPQIGILRRAVIVVDDDGDMLELVNPVIIDEKGEQEGLEGCLSVPGYYGEVVRPMWVTVRAQDRMGKTFEITGEEMTARCFCHETEHLDGHLYTEHCDEVYTMAELEAMDKVGGE